MNLTDYQRAAARTSDPSRDQRDRLSNAALGLAGETGEVVELVKKHLHHGHDLDSAKLAREIGDVLWYVSELCNVLGLDLASVARANVAKLQQRYPEGFSAQASRERVDVVPPLEIARVDESGETKWRHAKSIDSVFTYRRGTRRGRIELNGRVCWFEEGQPVASVRLATIDAAIAALDAWLTHGTVPGTKPTTPPHIPADASLLQTLTTAQEHIRDALGNAQEAQGRRFFELGVSYAGGGSRRAVMCESVKVPGALCVVSINDYGLVVPLDYATHEDAARSMRDWLGPDARKAPEVCEVRR